MFSLREYELIDFGDGRKLERFGRFVLDRPTPAADGKPKHDEPAWAQAMARYDRLSADRGEWSPRRGLPDCWPVQHGWQYGQIQLELKPTPFGHLGVFPEQAANWDWIAEQTAGRAARSGRAAMSGRAAPLKVLNLFAYTGGSTLAAAAAGAQVAHVDAARNMLAWARRNAELSGLADSPIRWLCEDAVKFARREVKRGNRYDAVILDPPSYGRGPHGEVWKVADDLNMLLDLCGRLLSDTPAFLLLSCHSAGMGPDILTHMVAERMFSGNTEGITTHELTLRDRAGRQLNCGVTVRWRSGA